MAILVIGEKPSVSKELAKVLGADQDKKTEQKETDTLFPGALGILVGLKYPNDYGGGWEEKWSFSQLPMIPEKWLFQVADSTKSTIQCTERPYEQFGGYRNHTVHRC